MTEASLFVAPRIGRRPAGRPPQNRSTERTGLPQRAAPEPGEQLALDGVDAPEELDLANFAEQSGLSGRRVDPLHRGNYDHPARALPGLKCCCDRPLPQRDELETRCAKCGRRR